MTRFEDRYRRQTILKTIGDEGQGKLLVSRVSIIGCGATGSVISNALVRSGVGHITIVDRDIVEPDNLQRQLLFDEEDIGAAKASAAATKLRRINSEVEVLPVVDNVGPSNIGTIMEGVDLIMDATDNMATRFLINEAAVKEGIPWVYTGVVGTMGMTMNIVPGMTACLKCALPSVPLPGSLPTCGAVGIINTIPTLMGSIAATEAIKLLLGRDWGTDMVVFDVWKGFFDRFRVNRRMDCECCVANRFDLLGGKEWDNATVLCGSNAVQLTPGPGSIIPIRTIAKNLQAQGDLEDRGEYLRFRTNGYELVIFKNGRTIVHGTEDERIARGLFSKYVGK